MTVHGESGSQTCEKIQHSRCTKMSIIVQAIWRCFGLDTQCKHLNHIIHRAVCCNTRKKQSWKDPSKLDIHIKDKGIQFGRVGVSVIFYSSETVSSIMM